MTWTCPDCKFQLTVDKIFYPVVCPCGLVDKGNNVITHVSKLVPKIRPNKNQVVLPKPSTAKSSFDDIKNAQGRKSWKLLHSYVGYDPQWFRLWLLTLPKDCPCNSKFLKLITSYPPDFSSPEKFWLWGHFIHNQVNQELRAEGKDRPEISIEEATRQWKTKYALWQPIEYGGMERWAIALTKHLPTFGIIPKRKDIIPDQEVYNSLTSLAKVVTVEDAVYHEKQIINSFVTDQVVPKGADIISVAHGNCKWTKEYIERASGHSKALVGVSPKTSKLVTEWTGRPCTTIENGVDTSVLENTATREEMRRFFGIPQDAFVVGYTGRQTSEKQIPLLLQSISKIPDAWGLIVGWPCQVDMHSIADSLGVSDRVRIVPPIEGPIANALVAMDVFCLLSQKEGFGLSIMEAMMFGLPIVTTNVGVVENLQEKHGDFLESIVSPDDSPYRIAEAIQRADRCKLDLSFYTAESMAKRWEAFLDSRRNELQ